MQRPHGLLPLGHRRFTLLPEADTSHKAGPSPRASHTGQRCPYPKRSVQVSKARPTELLADLRREAYGGMIAHEPIWSPKPGDGMSPQSAGCLQLPEHGWPHTPDPEPMAPGPKGPWNKRHCPPAVKVTASDPQVRGAMDALAVCPTLQQEAAGGGEALSD